MDNKNKTVWRVEMDISGHRTTYVLASTAREAVDHVKKVAGYFVKHWSKGTISASPCDEIQIDKEINNPGDKDA